MSTVEIHDAPDSLAAEWERMQGRDLHFITGPYLRALEALAAVARKAVTHLEYNANRAPRHDPGYVTTCVLLMRLDAPGGQLVEALTRLDVAAASLATGERDGEAGGEG